MAWGAAIEKIAEIQTQACPETAPKDRKTLTGVTQRPKHWREKGATKGERFARIDKLELSDEAKAAAAKRELEEFDRCRGDVKPTS